MIKIRKRHPLSRARVTIAALAAAAGCVGALSLPAGAVAAEAPLCGGSLELNDEIPGIEPPGGLSYKFNCNTQVLGYSIISSRQVDFFSTEVLVLDINSGEATNEAFGCEGPFPSSGFGCKGVSNFGNSMSGEFAIGRDPCEAAKTKSDKFKVWVSATVTQFDSVTNKPFTAVTQPFRLKGPDCSKAAPVKAAKRHQRASA
ncbi:MAG TPA: hypothetical protein VN758_01930 [Solirubrobacterales bacterium]|nr:hypothetical protein [Solirubrobacterales bacterium]